MKAIKTDSYRFYSVSDPHKDGVTIALRDYFMKKNLMLGSSYHVLQVDIPLTYTEYTKHRNELLTNLLTYDDFTVKKPRKRDKALALLGFKVIKEIAYGNGMAIAYYERIFGKKHVEFIFKENPTICTKKIFAGLEKLLSKKKY